MTGAVRPAVQLSSAEARAVAVRAQGFFGRRPRSPAIDDIHDVAARLGAIQIDSINVLVRAHTRLTSMAEPPVDESRP